MSESLGKKCEYCFAEVAIGAKKCRYCGEWINWWKSPGFLVFVVAMLTYSFSSMINRQLWKHFDTSKIASGGISAKQAIQINWHKRIFENGYYKIIGEVKNVSKEDWDSVWVEVESFNKDETNWELGSGYLSTLKAGAIKKFTIKLADGSCKSIEASLADHYRISISGGHASTR